MTDTAPATGTTDATQTETPAATPSFPPNTPVADMTPEQQADYWRDKAQSHEKQWKAVQEKTDGEVRKQLAATRKELDTLKQATMSETEKAVALARSEGRTEALREAASKVVAAEFRAAAAGRLDITDDILVGVNLAAFVDDNGDVDLAKVTKFIDGIAPKPNETGPPPFPDLGQGARGGSSTDPKTMALNGDPLLRSVKDKLGIQ